MNLIGGFLLAFSLYSRIPVPRVTWSRDRAGYALCFFPAVGVVTGILLLIWIRFAKEVIPGFPAHAGIAAVAAVLPVLVNGGIHLDGYVDVTDARSSYREREEKLRILKDPHIGAFAVIGLMVFFFLYFAGCCFFAEEDYRTMAGVFTLERALSGYAVAAWPKAKKDGMAAGLARDTRLSAVGVSTLLWILGSGSCILLVGKMSGAAVLAVTAFTFFRFRKMQESEFGGMTGDLAGYFLESAERNAVLTLALVRVLSGGLL